MTDHDALVRAVCEFPDDDTPRLVYADFLEEHGESDRAAFVRAQVELARTPAWEPFAVLCRHRKTEWSEAGGPFRHTLPPIPDGLGAGWSARPFRRGLGWRLEVGSLIDWDRLAPPLFDQAPIGEVVLNTSRATLDDLRRFAACGPVLRRLRVVHLTGGSPVEAVRVLADTPAAAGITDLYFHRASGAGMPELVEDLLRTPLGRGLKGLHFRVGYESLDYLIDALASGDATRPERLSFVNMGLTPAAVRRLTESALLETVTDLEIRNDRLGSEGVELLCRSPRIKNLTRLVLADARAGPSGWAALAGSPHLAGLRVLDLSGTSIAEDELEPILLSPYLAGIRSFALSGFGWDVRAIARKARFWPNLVELDLRDGWGLTRAGVNPLLAEQVPAELTALRLTAGELEADSLDRLRAHFGERVILEDRPAD